MASAIYPTRVSSRPVDDILSDVAAVAMNPPKNFVGTRILPPTPFGVAAKTGVVIRAAIAAAFGDGSTSLRRAPGASFATAPGATLDNVTYIAEQYGFQTSIPDETQRDAQLNLWKFKLGIAASLMAIERERTLLDFLSTAATWTESFTAGTAWTAAGSDPMSDLATAQSAIDKYGPSPNTIVLGYAAFDALRRNSVYLSFGKSTDDRQIASTNEVLANIAAKFDIPADRVFLAKASKNTANAGAEAVLERIMGGRAWLGYIELGEGTSVTIDGQSVNTVATAALRLPVQPMEVEQFRDANLRSEVANLTFEEAIVAVNPQLGCLVSGCA
jgi:hypothetical protein